MKSKLMEMLESRKDEIIEIRRHLHENPELSFKEEKTAQYIIDFYKGKDVEVQSNVGNGYGIIVTIKGGKPGKNIGFALILMHFQSLKKQMYPLNQKMKALCMRVVMMVIQPIC